MCDATLLTKIELYSQEQGGHGAVAVLAYFELKLSWVVIDVCPPLFILGEIVPQSNTKNMEEKI